MAIKAPVALTYEDLQDFPDDGYRRELVHGQLIVSAASVRKHQRAAFRLGFLLGAACPPHLEILPAPCDWAVSEDTVFEPDLIVVRRDDPGDRRIEGTPLLVVEVLSPSTRDTDTVLKRYEYKMAVGAVPGRAPGSMEGATLPPGRLTPRSPHRPPLEWPQ